MLLLWIVSGLGRIVTKRFDSNAAGHDPWSAIITRIYLIVVALGVFAALRLHAAAALWPSGVIPVAVFLLGLGLALQWYAIIQIRDLVKANAAATPKNRVIPPYYFLWRLSYAGSLLAVIGLSLSFMNWASLLIMCVPACALVLWRIRTVPAGGKGSSVA
jgi:protein-S-isoprenylcysteine O-methyltransferase Ste14